MKKYSAYKDSGIEWIGEIPEHWKAIRLKHMVDVKITDGPHETPEFVEEGGVPFLSAEAIQGNVLSIKHKRGNITREQYEIYAKKSLVLKGDTLFCKSGSTTGKSAFVEIDEEFGIWSPLAIIRSQTNYDKRFVYYCIQSEHFRLQVETSWTFGTQPNIGMGSLENLWISASSTKQEQTTIANYLDRKTAEIDTLIEQKKQLIALYQEERTSTINHAVTKGLDPNVSMKHSGIDWIGEIPEHWKKSRFKYLILLKARLGWKGLKADEYISTREYGFLSTPNIKNKEIEFEKINFITKERYEESPEIMLEINDVLLAKDGSTLGIVNIVRDLPFPCTVNSSIGVLRIYDSEILDPNYLRYFIESHYCQNIINRIKGGMGVPHLFQADINNFEIILPPIVEQGNITQYIESKIGDFDLQISKTEREIELLTEYKTALISEVVLGKVDVRGEVLN